MAKIFLSHSSKDKDFVKKLALDLKGNGHQPWLDEWEIKVGDYITDKIERGLKDSEFVILVISNNSSNSNWVNREWKSVFWNEIQNKEILILPVLIDSCEIPNLIIDKKYADFTSNYEQGLNELLRVFIPEQSHVNINRNEVKTSLKVIDVELKHHSTSFLANQAKNIENSIRILIKNDSTEVVERFKIELLLPKHAGNTTDYNTNPLFKHYSHEDNEKHIYSFAIEELIYPGETKGIMLGEISIKKINAHEFYNNGIEFKLYSSRGMTIYHKDIKHIFKNGVQEIAPDSFTF